MAWDWNIIIGAGQSLSVGGTALPIPISEPSGSNLKLDTGDLMAVKEIRFQDLASAPQLIKQVRDEMRVMEMLSHPNIVEYYGIEVHRDKVYIFEECASSVRRDELTA